MPVYVNYRSAALQLGSTSWRACEESNLTKNVSDIKKPIEFQMSSSLLVLIDPLVLNGLGIELQKLVPSEVAKNPRMIRALPGPMKVGLHRVESFVPGIHSIENDDIEGVGDDQTDEGVFDIDTGTLIVADLDYLPRLARILTWETYDGALRSPQTTTPGCGSRKSWAAHSSGYFGGT